MSYILSTRGQSDIAESNTSASFSCGVNARRESRISHRATANCAFPDSEESEETQLAVARCSSKGNVQSCALSLLVVQLYFI